MKKTNLKLTHYFLRGSYFAFIIAAISALGIVLTDMITPQIIRVTVDSVIGSEPLDLPGFLADVIYCLGGIEVLKSQLWLIAMLVIINAVFAVFFRYTFRVSNTIGAERLVRNMRNKIFHHIERLPFAWHMKNRTGDIIQRCTSDVETIKNFLSEQLTSVFRIIMLLSLSLVFMLSMNVRLTLIALGLTPILLIAAFFFHKFIKREFEICDDNEGKLSAIAQENLTGVRVVRAFGREAYEREKFEAQNNKYAYLWEKLGVLYSAYWSISDIIAGVQILLVIVFGAVMCVDGEMTSGSYIAFISYNTYLVWPVRQLGRSISELSKASVSLGRIGEIMNSELEHDRPDATAPDMTGDIEFDGVSFSYDGEIRVLDNVTFTVKGGSTVGILGGTGSGKSTLVHLLDRLYDIPADCGSIRIGGVDIANMQAQWVRKNIGIVLQDPFLFSRSIADNIAITQEQTDIEAVRKCAADASFDDSVMSFSEGYETFVGERGVTLSGGQKQRAAIARMLIQNTPIMVFDDSFSALDTETDAKIRASLRSRHGKSTTFLISHRTATLMNADLIVVLDRGCVAEIGTHAELLSANGLYRRIYNIQNGEEVE